MSADALLDAEIRRHFDSGDLGAAATAALEGFGSEILGYLIAVLRGEEAAGEVFSQLSEDLWRGLPAFGWRCSFRTWLYALARHAAARYRRSPVNRPERRVALSELSAVADRVRSRTLPYLRSEVKDRFAELREALDPDDQELLILRVNRKLSWNEVAIVTSEGGPVDDAELARASARLRQRFQTLKRRLRQLAEERGLLEARADDSQN